MSFPRYPECKDSGVEWLGEVPVHWYIKPLKYVATYNDEVLPESTSKDYPIKYVEISDVDEQLGITKWTEYPFASAPSRARRILKDGDVLISTVRTYLRAIAPVTEPPDGFVGSTGFAVIRPVPGIYYSALLGYVIRAEWFISNIISRSVGVSYPAINASDLVALSLPVPPWKEQKTIARFLDHETAKIDTLIHEQKRLIELLKEKRQALVLSAFSLSDSVETRLANAVNLIYKPVSQKVDETYIPIGLFNRGRGLFHKDPRGIEEMGESDFFWVNDGDLIISGQFAWEGAVALAGEKEQGKVVSHRYPILRGKNGIVTTEYIFALLTTRHGDFLLNENSRGAAGRNKPLNISALLKEKITIPAFSLQNKIVEIVHQERQIKAEASRQKKLLLEHRAALISAAVTGKIDVRGWQPPAYESAFDEEIRQAEIKVTA